MEHVDDNENDGDEAHEKHDDEEQGEKVRKPKKKRIFSTKKSRNKTPIKR